MAPASTTVAIGDKPRAAIVRTVRAVSRAVTPFVVAPADARLFHAWRP